MALRLPTMTHAGAITFSRRKFERVTIKIILIYPKKSIILWTDVLYGITISTLVVASIERTVRLQPPPRSLVKSYSCIVVPSKRLNRSIWILPQMIPSASNIGHFRPEHCHKLWSWASACHSTGLHLCLMTLRTWCVMHAIHRVALKTGTLANGATGLLQVTSLQADWYSKFSVCNKVVTKDPTIP